VTRRSVVAWGGAGTLGLAIGTGTSATSRAATLQELIVTGSASTFPTFSEDLHQRFTNALPNAVEMLSPVSVGGGSVRISFDPRMLGLSDGLAQLVADGGVSSTPMSVDGGSVTIPIPASVKATHIVVVLPFFASVRYPAENTGASTAPTAHVTVGEHVADAFFPIDQPTEQGVVFSNPFSVNGVTVRTFTLTAEWPTEDELPTFASTVTDVFFKKAGL
jgi:hypothetical protein